MKGWDDSEDKENYEEDQEGAVNFEIIIEETWQSVIDSAENVEAEIIEEMIRKSGDENENDEEIIQETLEKIDLQSLAWYIVLDLASITPEYQNFKLFFCYFFTSISLMNGLRQRTQSGAID